MAFDVKVLVLKYLEEVKPNISLGEALSIIRSKIVMSEKIVETLEHNFKEWGIGDFVTCPHCGSKTLLEFAGCHWCGHHLLDQTHEAPKKVEPTPAASAPVSDTPRKKNEQISMNGEPAATINWEGKSKEELEKEAIPVKEEKPKRTRKPKATEELQKKEPAKEEEAPKKSSSVSKEEKIQLLSALIVEAKASETGVGELKKINEIAGLGLVVKDFKKLSVFRQAVVEGLEAALKHFQKEPEKKVEEAKVEEKPKKERAPRKKKEKAPVKEEVADPDFDEEMEEVPSPFDKKAKAKGPKVIEVTEEELTTNDDDFEVGEEELDEDVAIDLNDVDDEIEAVNLDDLDVEDLNDDDFNLDDE